MNKDSISIAFEEDEHQLWFSTWADVALFLADWGVKRWQQSKLFSKVFKSNEDFVKLSIWIRNLSKLWG